MFPLNRTATTGDGKLGKSLGTYSSLNRKCVSETRVGYRVGQGFISGCFRNSAGEAYRSRYAYFSNLVARTRLLTSYSGSNVVPLQW